MKAVIDGIEIHGTPQEIDEYMRINKVGRHAEVKKPVNVVDWVIGKPSVTMDSPKGSCPSAGMPCYCTGACMK